MNELRRLGLTNYEEKAYVALLKSGPMIAAKASEKSEIPRTKIYPTLKSLEKYGFVEILQTKPMSFKAIEPRIAIWNYTKNLVREREESGAKAIDKLEQSRV